MKTHRYYVYILSSENNRVLYIGMTNDLIRRVGEHRNEMIDGFTKRYHVHKLIYFQEFQFVEEAIRIEKKLKGWKRTKKETLIDSLNPNRRDLFDDICKW